MLIPKVKSSSLITLLFYYLSYSQFAKQKHRFKIITNVLLRTAKETGQKNILEALSIIYSRVAKGIA